MLFFVFGGGCGVVVLSARDAGRALASVAARALTAALARGHLLFPIWNPFAAEWFAVAGDTGFASVQLDLILDERRARADPRWRRPREARLDAAGA